jgi:hypothetical protein
MLTHSDAFIFASIVYYIRKWTASAAQSIIIIHVRVYKFKCKEASCNHPRKYETSATLVGVQKREIGHKMCLIFLCNVLWDVDARRDNHVKLEQMFNAVRTNITDDQGNRACLRDTGEHSRRRGLAWASDGGDTVVLEKGRLAEAGCSSRHSGLPSANVGVLPCNSPGLRVGAPAGCRVKLLQ